MKILAVYPILNQEDRIQPFFRLVEKHILDQIDGWLFIDEYSQDKSIEILQRELELKKNNFHIETYTSSTNRLDSFKVAYNFALQNEYDYMIIFNEGWEDNIHELINIIRSKEYEQYDLVMSCRHVYELSPGSIYNILSNILSSLLTGKLVRETKGDSINILKVANISKNINNLTSSNLFYFQYLLGLLKDNGEVLYSDVDNGLNYRSFVRLNTLRFFCICLSLLKFKFKHKSSETQG